jgi:long-subunit fatty acid transport protein
MLRHRGVASAWIAAVILWPAVATGQTGQTAQIPLQFDFLNPGARSLGLGSAFVAVADDATSAFTNPAGLTQIVRMEAYAELRYRRLETRYLTGGRLSGRVTHEGVDTVVGPRYGISDDSAWRPYFLSFVYPRGRWSLAGYRHELVLQSNPFLSDGPFRQVIFNDTVVVNNSRQLGLIGSRRISIDNYGVAAGYRFSERVSVGVGVSVYRFTVASDFASLGFADTFDPADPSTKGLNSTTIQRGDDTQAAINAGFLIAVNRKIRVGAVYRQGADFDFQHVSSVSGAETTSLIGQFRTPAVAGIGIRLLPSIDWMFAFDFVRVQYSRLRDDYIAFQVSPTDLPTIGIPDGNELHFAAEYTFTALPRQPSLRLGAWYDPSHSVHYASNFSNSDDDIRLRAIFPANESLWHFSIGAGVPLSDDYEFNAGADFTKGRRYVSTSIIARFGR